MSMNTKFMVLFALFLLITTPFASQAQPAYVSTGSANITESEDEVIKDVTDAKEQKASLNATFTQKTKEYHSTVDQMQKDLKAKRDEADKIHVRQSKLNQGTEAFYQTETEAAAAERVIKSLVSDITSARSDYKEYYEGYQSDYNAQLSNENSARSKLWIMGAKSAKGKALAIAPAEVRKTQAALKLSEAARKKAEADRDSTEQRKQQGLNELDKLYQAQLLEIADLKKRLRTAQKTASKCTNHQVPRGDPISTMSTTLKSIKEIKISTEAPTENGIGKAGTSTATSATGNSSSP
jgi:hypothetical protein